MKPQLFYDTFSGSITLAIAMIFFSVAFELFMVHKRWISLLRSVAGLFLLSSLAHIIGFLAFKIVEYAHRNGVGHAFRIFGYTASLSLLTIAWGLMMFWNIKIAISNWKENSKEREE